METKLAIVGVRRSDGALVQISGPEIPYREQEQRFMQFRLNRENAEYSETNLCEVVPIRTERHTEPTSNPTKGKSPMKALKSIVSMIAIAAFMLIAPATQAQSYNLSTCGFASTFNIAGASTNTTVAATNGSSITIKGTAILAIQPTFKLTEAGTSTVVFKFDESVDGSTWKIASRSVSVAATGTTTVGTVLNITDACANFFRLSQIENPNTGALTNIVVKYAYKTP